MAGTIDTSYFSTDLQFMERMIGGFSQSTDGLSFTIELAEITT